MFVRAFFFDVLVMLLFLPDFFFFLWVVVAWEELVWADRGVTAASRQLNSSTVITLGRSDRKLSPRSFVESHAFAQNAKAWGTRHPFPSITKDRH